MKYEVCKYCGRTYCGNGFFETLDECLIFANDGFCDRAVITSRNDGMKLKIKIEREE